MHRSNPMTRCDEDTLSLTLNDPLLPPELAPFLTPSKTLEINKIALRNLRVGLRVQLLEPLGLIIVPLTDAGSQVWGPFAGTEKDVAGSVWLRHPLGPVGESKSINLLKHIFNIIIKY